MARRFLSSRVALAVAVSAGLGAVALPVPASAKAKPEVSKITFSPAFAKAAAELDKAVSESSKNAAVTAAAEKVRAAATPAAKQAAQAEVDAALGGAQAKLAAAAAVATTPGDKLKLGEITRNVGVLFSDPAQQHTGLVSMIDSGVLAPEQLGQVQFLAGVTAYQYGDYAGAIQYIKPSFDSGYRDQGGLIERVLADSYKRTNNNAAALELAQRNLAAARAAGTKPSEEAIRVALQAAYDAKNVASSADLCAELARNYPTTKSWTSALGVVRQLAALPAQENLDLMRLMFRTGAMTEKRDYFEYIENVDPRRQPGEALKVMDAGVASGKVTSAEVAEYRQIANGRLAADKASLASLERDAHSATAPMNTITAAADAFLGYGQPVKAEELYKIALAKPGADKDRAFMRIGIAQVDQGKYADAKQSFGQVTGNRLSVAKVWIAYVDTKAAPAT